jgi:Icc-related predicted phosphoesterase
MKICLISDLHMEIGGYPGKSKYMPEVDVLILGGDITCARYFTQKAIDTKDVEAKDNRRHMTMLMDYYGKKAKHVIYIMGNHEHYGFNINDSKDVMKTWLKKYPNVRVAENESFEIDDYLFIACTLWSDYMGEDNLQILTAQSYMNDFRVIKKRIPGDLETNITPRDCISRHKDSVAFIEYTLFKNPDKKTVIMTHHAPSLKSHNHSRGMEILGAYCSDLTKLIHKYPQIKLWTHGHTHDNVDYLIDDCQIVANHRGYEGYETCAKIFDPYRGVIELS